MVKENFNKGWAETPAVHQHFESIPFNTKGNNYKSPCYIPQFCKIWIASLSPLTFQWKIWSNLEPHARARADTSFCKCYIYHQGNALLLDVHILNMHNIALYSFISLQNGCEPCSLSNRCDISMQAFPDLQRSVFQLILLVTMMILPTPYICKRIAIIIWDVLGLYLVSSLCIHVSFVSGQHRTGCSQIRLWESILRLGPLD